MTSDINLKKLIFLYSILKRFVAELTPSQISKLEAKLSTPITTDDFISFINETIKREGSRTKIIDLIKLFKDEIKVNEITRLAICYLRFKDFILKEKTNRNSFEIIEAILQERFQAEGLTTPSYKLTSTYDNYTSLSPYSDRVFSVCLMSSQLENFYKKEGITGSLKEAIHVFQIALDESMMQSGRSNSGGDYESRISELFKHFNLKFLKHHHESNDQSQEHDFIIEYKDKKIGVGAKRTLRERYKQYNPAEVDCSVVFTIGEDLNDAKARTITDSYNSFIFVADEIYKDARYLQTNNKIFKVTDFNLNTLDILIGEQ